MANTIIAWKYTATNGNTYVTGVNSELTTQTDGGGNVKIGGSAVTATTDYDPVGRSFRPRKAVMAAAGKKNRYVTVFDEACPLWTVAATTLDIEDSDGASTTYGRQRKLEEKFKTRRAGRV